MSMRFHNHCDIICYSGLFLTAQDTTGKPVVSEAVLARGSMSLDKEAKTGAL